MGESDFSKEVLKWLWEHYRIDSNGVYDIAPLCKNHGSDPLVLSTDLLQKGLIKDDIVIGDGKVCCSISIKGIATIDPQFVEDMIGKILAGMAGVNSINNIMGILKLEQRDFQLAFDLANEMQNRDLVKLLYAFQPGRMVNVELTLEGVRRKG